MTRRQIASAIKTLNVRRNAVARERDRLRNAADDLGSLAECCERAEDHLQSAIDALSELA
jgi:hypothetical protein